MTGRLRTGIVTAAIAFAVLTAPVAAVAQQQPAPSDRVLPDFDVREGRPPQPPSASVAAELARASGLRGTLPSRVHPYTGAIRVLEAPGLSVGRALPNSAVQSLLVSLADRLGLDSGDLASLTLSRDYVSRSNNVRHVVFAQAVDGLPVFDAIVSVHLDAAGTIVRVTSSAGRGAGRRRAPQVAAGQAVAEAAMDIRPDTPFNAARLPGASDPGGVLRFARGAFRRDLTASLTWLPMDGGIRLAWHVTVEPEGETQIYDVLVDAESGEVLIRRNRVRYTEGAGRVLQSSSMNAIDPRRPDPMPAGQPGAQCPPPVNYFVRSLNAPFRDPSTALFDTGRLSGNNTHVFRKSPATEGALGTFDGVKWNFDFPYNSDDSAETTLFFGLNFAHDFFYDLGFDEAAGNFQVDNFGRGGVAGDPVKGNARAVGRNNANYVHAVDGTSPRINMFLWDSTGCWGQDVDGDDIDDVDGDYDFDIIMHEYHHGVSMRLNTSFSGVEAGAVGEGGSDFFAYTVNGDTTLAEYARPGGLRGINSKTYADWTCRAGLFCEVHDNGEIWANVLWDIRERFRLDHVRGSEASGINESHQLYVDALKLSPPFPTMLDMRDAMLQADSLRNPAGPGSANFCRLWEGFAGRGMGTAARDTADNGFNSVVADFSVPDGCVAPSILLPTVTVSVGIPTATEAGQTPGVFTIGRSAVGSDPIVVQFSVSGTATNGNDYQAVPASATIPAGAAEVTVPIVPIDDTVLEANETVQIRLRSGGPYIVGVPSTGTVTIVSDDVAADLVVTGLSVPASGGAGLAIQVNETTANQGSGPAAGSTTSFYLSRNAVLDGADPLIGSRTVPALASGASSAAATMMTLPDPLESGSYTLFAKADGPGAIGESNEYNNVRLAFIQIGPDLTMTALSAPASAGAGTPIVVSDTTTNVGRGTAAASTTRFYLSSDYTLDSGDVLLQGRSVPALGESTSSAGSTSMMIPASTADGTYYLVAKADGADGVAESNETNNIRLVLLRIGPDLVIPSATAPARAAGGAVIAVTETTQNIGTGGAGGSVTGFYLSTNALLDPADLRLTSRGVDPLGPGASSVRTTTVTLPNVASGTWYLIVNADDNKTVVETQETNNARYLSVLIGPDLNVSSLLLPFTVKAGASVAVTDTVKNLGAADAGASTIRFHLSSNAALDAGDAILGSRQVPALAAGLSSTGTTTVTIPSALAGTYYLFAIADAMGEVSEASESNNAFLRVVVITP